MALKADRREMQYGLESKADRTELDGSVVRAQSLLGQVEDLRVCLTISVLDSIINV